MRINDTLEIPDEELGWTFARSGGPGGQNVNKVNSRAVLHWAIARNASLPEDVRTRIRARERNRLTVEGELLIQSQRHRTQERNREDCLDRLREIVLAALTAPKKRRPTRPTRASKLRRLADKKARSERKESRRGAD
jgi:ribosome-associated protein